MFKWIWIILAAGSTLMLSVVASEPSTPVPYVEQGHATYAPPTESPFTPRPPQPTATGWYDAIPTLTPFTPPYSAPPGARPTYTPSVVPTMTIQPTATGDIPYPTATDSGRRYMPTIDPLFTPGTVFPASTEENGI